MMKLTRMNLLILWNVFLTLLIMALSFWILDLENERRNLISNVEDNRNIIEVLIAAINENNAKIDNVEWEVDTLEGSVYGLEWEVDGLEWDIDELERDVDNLEWDILNLQQDVRRLKYR